MKKYKDSNGTDFALLAIFKYKVAFLKNFYK